MLRYWEEGERRVSEERSEDTCHRCNGTGVAPDDDYTKEEWDAILCRGDIPPPCRTCGGHGELPDIIAGL